MFVAGGVEPLASTTRDFVVFVSHHGGRVAETSSDRGYDFAASIANEVFLEHGLFFALHLQSTENLAIAATFGG